MLRPRALNHLVNLPQERRRPELVMRGPALLKHRRRQSVEDRRGSPKPFRHRQILHAYVTYVTYVWPERLRGTSPPDAARAAIPRGHGFGLRVYAFGCGVQGLGFRV